MFQKTIAFFFFFLFLALLAAPTVISIVDEKYDTSVFYSISEEEENGHSKTIISPFDVQSNHFEFLLVTEKQSVFLFGFKRYPKTHLNLISPPPECIIA